MHINFKKIRGFTLIEIMIALVINALLLTGIIDIFIANLSHYRKFINANQLNEQLQSAMQMMVTEIRRAGYSANAQNDVGISQNNNPFMASGTDISVNGSNNCILFSYDRDNNGTLPAINAAIDDERYGFSLNTTTQTIQTRPPGAVFSCTNNASSWENMTDPNIVRVTNLTFTLNQTTVTSGNDNIILRSVDINLTGQLTSDTSISKTITAHVRLRNDKYVP